MTKYLCPVLIEQDKMAGSTTKRSTAKLTYLQQNILSKITKARNPTPIKNKNGKTSE